jgi:hypothetical protein
MLEHLLTAEMQRVGDQLPLPADLFDGAQLQTDRTSYRWVARAAVTATLVVIAFSPMGHRALAEATRSFMQHTVRILYAANLNHASQVVPFSDIKIGQNLMGRFDEKTQQVLKWSSLAETLRTEPDWVLPKYLSPPQDAKVVRVESRLLRDNELVGYSIDVGWQVVINGNHSMLHYSFSPHTVSLPNSPAIYKRESKAQVTPVLVTVKNQPIYAVPMGNTWSIAWINGSSYAVLSGTVPLDELVKVAASIPNSK